MKSNGKSAIIAVSLAVASIVFLLSFTGFDVTLNSQDVVSGDEVFVSTDEIAIKNFLNGLEETALLESQEQLFGIGIFIDFKDSNGVIIPQDSNFLKIPLTEKSIVVETASLIGGDGQLLDFARIQFDVTGIVTKDTKVNVKADYEILSNDAVFLTGVISNSGQTTNNRLDLDFKQGTKTGQALELSFEKNEIPIIVGSGSPKLNTLEFRITSVEAIIGENFDTEQYLWSGSFPVYQLSYNADDQTRTIRDFTGMAIQTLPNDVGIQVCGNDFGRLASGTPDVQRNAPSITVKDMNGVVVLQSSAPNYGSRDADFNSYKCGNINSGLERDTQYKFITNGVTTDVMTPDSPILYNASCKASLSGSSLVVKCTSNYGWSQ